MASHIDPINGDCEETQAPCTWSKIGCPETKVGVTARFTESECSCIRVTLPRFRTLEAMNAS